MISLHHSILKHVTFGDRHFLYATLETVQETTYPDYFEVEGKTCTIRFTLYHKNSVSNANYYYPTIPSGIPVVDTYALFVFTNDKSMNSWVNAMGEIYK